MNYIFYYKGTINSHIYESLNSVLSNDEEARIFFCSDQKILSRSERFNLINLNEINSDLIDEIDKLEKFEKLDNNPLWKTSLMRVFYIYELAQNLKLNSFVHFDSDVLIYKSYEELIDNFSQSKVNITQLSKDMLIFGYCYVANLDNYKKVCESIIEIYEKKSYYENTYYDGKSLVEMRSLYLAYLSNPDLFNILPSLPAKNENILFDPLSYGQYLGGRNYKKFSKGYLDMQHLSYYAMKSKEVVPKYKKGKAFIVHKKNNIDLANLHVHSKNLSKYRPASYSNYFYL